MRVVVLGHTSLTNEAYDLFDELNYEFDWPVNQVDELVEFAGRNCYLSFDKPNPATRTNKDYIALNIIGKSHESVFEHGHVTFYVDGISRNLLLELERHRHISYSVLSTRYVDPQKYSTVLHPGLVDKDLVADAENLDAAARALSKKIYDQLRSQGSSPKEARTVARSVLLGSTETKIVVSGNIRAWRYVIKMRMDESADPEIRMFATGVLKRLREVAPHSVQDIV